MADILMKETLQAYLLDARKGFLLEEQRDCCTFMADWLMLLGLPDVMADRRGTYANKDEYLAMLNDEGGLLSSCDRRFASLGLVPTDTPQVGDVAVVNRHFSTGAIVVEPGYFAVLVRGCVLVSKKILMLKAWTVNCA